MKQDIQRIMLAAVKAFVSYFYSLYTQDYGSRNGLGLLSLGGISYGETGLVGILTHPLIHSGFSHLLANTIPLFFLSWCLFYFYRGIAGKIFILIWLGGGLLTFLIGKPGCTLVPAD